MSNGIVGVQVDGAEIFPLGGGQFAALCEGAGVIEAIGRGVQLKVGQHVALSWMPSCGRCEECVRGLTHLCRVAWTGMSHGGLLDGTPRLSWEKGPIYHYSYLSTFAQAAVVPERCVIPIPDNVSFDIAALVGCAERRMAPVMAQVLAGRGCSALVVRGDDGLDEITVSSTTSVWLVSGGRVTAASLDPLALGVPRAALGELRGGDAAANAEVARRLLAGSCGAVRDAVLLNAGAAVAAHAGWTGDLVADVHAGRERVTTALDSGAAAALLSRWAQLSTELRAAGPADLARRP